MNETKIPIETVAARLEKALQCDVGMEGVEVLLHGFVRKGFLSRDTMRQRKQRDGYLWFNPYELENFSRYAGYDLSRD